MNSWGQDVSYPFDGIYKAEIGRTDDNHERTIATFFLREQVSRGQVAGDCARCMFEEIEKELPSLEWPTYRIDKEERTLVLLRPEEWSYEDLRKYTSALCDLASKHMWEVNLLLHA